MGNVIPCGGSRHSSAANSGQASHRTSTLWTTGPQSLPDHNGHRQNSKPVVGVAGDNGGPPSASTPSGGHDPTLNMPTATSKMQIGNSVTSSFVGIRMASPHLHQGGGGSISGGGSNTEHQLRMRRPSKVKCQLGIAK